VPAGSGLVGWAVERDGGIWRTGAAPRDAGRPARAILAGAWEYDADDIAEVIARTASAEFRPAGRPEPSREPFPIVSKGGGRVVF